MTKVDKTHLSATKAEERGIIHRDLIAHCHRWSHVAKFLHQGKNYDGATILDIGCGKETPMARTLYSNRLIPAQYVGIDANKTFEDFNFGKMKADIHTGLFPYDVDISDNAFGIGDKDYVKPDVIVSFEVLEHVQPDVTYEMLSAIWDIAHEETTIFISTPCYDERVGSAANHPNEITRDALGALLEDIGFEIEGNWGTFASIRDYEKEMSSAEHIVFQRLRDYYDTNVLATIFAPLYPEKSRNNLWKLKRATPDYQRKFPPLEEVPGPWTSNSNWRDLDGCGGF